MRAMLCYCNRHLEAENDELLLAALRDHLAKDHPEVTIGGEQLRQVVRAKAYDLEYVNVYGAGGGPDEEFGPEPY